MNKQELLARRDYFNLVHGVTVRAVDAFNDSELDFRPKAGMPSVDTQNRPLIDS